MEAAIREKSEATKKVAEAKDKESVAVLYKIPMKDTSTMSEEQHKKHEITCSYILQNFKTLLLCCKLVLISHYVIGFFFNLSLCCNCLLTMLNVEFGFNFSN